MTVYKLRTLFKRVILGLTLNLTMHMQARYKMNGFLYRPWHIASHCCDAY